VGVEFGHVVALTVSPECFFAGPLLPEDERLRVMLILVDAEGQAVWVGAGRAGDFRQYEFRLLILERRSMLVKLVLIAASSRFCRARDDE
jgi:hypothetical protein